ncbi:MAG: fructosamine kinase family protein [Candidatus Gastranaerophilales bacterium]|nr:fructosamine kinase family protein [Candidatus Gastranaerophilales bacterium]
MNNIKVIVEEQLNTTVTSVKPIGNGNTASCYCVDISNSPFKLIIKTSKHYELTCEEKKMNDFLRQRVNFKIPKTYFIAEKDGVSYLAMEYVNGASGRILKLKQIKDKPHLANNIIDCFIDMQSVHNDKFGYFENPAYDSWKEYYRDFFEKIYTFANDKYNQGELNKKVLKALNLIKINFDEIFDNIENTPCLSHGDFWTPNMIIDIKNSEIEGVIDPFNTRYVEPEYELFCLTLGLGEKLKLYDLYKSRVQTSKYCDLKVELYALCNEIDWWMKLGEIETINYIKMRSKKLIKQIKKCKLKRMV